MEKQTKILLGIGAVIAAYLILKPKKAIASTENKNGGGTTGTENEYLFVDFSQEQKAFYLATIEKYQLGARPKNNDIINTPFGKYKFTLKQGVASKNVGGYMASISHLFNEGYWTMEQKNPTKDCVVSSYNCVTTTYETIQIPIDDECYKYQNANPPCAGPPPERWGN